MTTTGSGSLRSSSSSPSPSRDAQTLACQAASVLVAIAALRVAWPTIHDVVVAIDHGDVLFADFLRHYYPTVHGNLRHDWPAEGFFYPAGFAVLIAPLGWMPPSAAKLVWGVLEVGCVLWAATSLVRAAIDDRPLLAGLATLLTLTSVPVLHNLKWGRVSILILGATAGAFVAYARDRKNLAAALLAVAAGIKGYPIVFLGWFVARGDGRFVLRASAACVVTLVLLPAIVMGPGHALYFQRISSSSVLGAAEGVLRDFNSQHALAVVGRLCGGPDRVPPAAIAWTNVGSVAALVALGLLVLGAARSKAPRIACRRDLIGFVLIASSVPFWLHTSWSHYFVHLPLAQALLVLLFMRPAKRRAGSSRQRNAPALALALLVAPSVYLTNVLGLFAAESWWAYANAGSLFFANLLVLLGWAAFLLDAHVLDERPRSEPLRRA